MATIETSLQVIYANMVQEATSRLNAAQGFLSSYGMTKNLPELEAAVLQIRKSLESIALASIAPNKVQYAAFRAMATDSPDYTKDYHASRIFNTLEKINKDFYPLALLPAVRQPDGTHHFGRKQSGFLSKKRFESIYDRLGKHLHAHNPWGTEKHLHNLAKELPQIIDQAFGLIDLHVTFIRTPQYKGAWVIEASRTGNQPKVITSVTEGDFAVQDS